MKISQNAVFTDLAETGAPSISWTVYHPTENWSRPELLAHQRGTILIQVADSGAGCFYPEIIAIWFKRWQNGDNRDWALMFSMPASGNSEPASTNADLCALPIGSVYVQTEGVNCVDQLWIKVTSRCSGVGCPDWIPLLMRLSRIGDEVEFDADTNTLNLPPSGTLKYLGNGDHQWVPDDGGPGFHVYVPILTDNEDGTYTFDQRDGTTPITWATDANLTIPADISAVQRPWVEIGQSAASNATNVGSGAHIFHLGSIVRGATSIGTTGTVGAELGGNNSLGASNHVMTAAENSTIGGGSSNENKSTKNSFIGAGVDNVISGATDPTSYNANFIGAGTLNDNFGKSASIVGGDDNEINNGGIVAFIGGGSKNKATGNGAAILGGYFNEATQFWATALGSKSKAWHTASFLINTHLGTNPATDSEAFESDADGEFAIRVASVRILTNLAETAGMTMAGGASSWVAVSDARAKNDIQPLTEDVLAGYKVLIPVSYFMGERVGAGITAQNWYESFPFLEKKHVGEMFGVSQAERDGIQDKAIKQLLERVEALEARLAQYEGD